MGAACLGALGTARQLHAMRRGTAIAISRHRAIAVARVLPAAAVAAVRAVGLAVLTAAAACPPQVKILTIEASLTIEAMGK